MVERGRLPDHRVVFSLVSISLLGALYVVNKISHYSKEVVPEIREEPNLRDINYSSSRVTEPHSRDYQTEKK